MVENTSSCVFLPIRFGSLILLILCLNSVSSQSAEPLETTTFKDEEWMSGISEDETYQNVSVVNEQSSNSTEHKGFLHGFVESLSVILVSEIGDKTFFIAAILAMSNNKLTVFLGAISALAVMTILSALLGFVVTTFIPREYTYYTCTAIMFLFGVKMLWEAWRMKPNESEETQREVEEEVAARHGSSPSLSSRPQDEEEGAKEEEMKNMNPCEEDDIEECDKNETKTEEKPPRKALHVQIREKSNDEVRDSWRCGVVQSHRPPGHAKP